MLRTVSRELAGTSETAALDASLLLAHVLGHSRSWLVAHADERVAADALCALQTLARRRRAGEPVAYLVGEAWFFGRPFQVSPDVLVPRPETEHLIEAALAELRARRMGPNGRLRACDVGTGSGAIALTLAAEMDDLQVAASDVSAPALDIARKNAERMNLTHRLTFVCGDLAEPLVPLGPFDCIVANLPYVPTGEVPARPNPVGFEPRTSVDGGADGLVLYRRLIRKLPALAAPGGLALLEAGPATIQALADAVVCELPRAHVEVGEDYSGLERWVAVSLP